MKKVVRVATTNNFNCTAKEWNQLEMFSEKYPNNYFFVNANINTPRLKTVNDHNFKVVVTINPDLIPVPGCMEKLEAIDPSKVAFVRLKWLPDNTQIHSLFIHLLTAGYKVVLTIQRFNSKESMLKYTDGKNYKFSCSRFRLNGEALTFVQNLVDHYNNMGMQAYICDRNGTGCQGCLQCSTLTANTADAEIFSLNLSTSGVCPYDCPDCYAKTMQHFCTSMGHNPIWFDKVYRNKKQAGTTKHIKESKLETANA